MAHENFNLAYITLLGNKPGTRIGLVKYNEAGGYYPCEGYDYAGDSLDEVKARVAELNKRLEIPEEVADSMTYASLFGWNAPCAAPAHAYFARVSQDAPAVSPVRDALTLALRNDEARLYMLPVGDSVDRESLMTSIQTYRDALKTLDTDAPAPHDVAEHLLHNPATDEDTQTCLCVMGCSVNGECPIHGDGGHDADAPPDTSARERYRGPW